jgi:hypothetical protein
MPVIQTSWEAEIRRIAVQDQPQQIVRKTSISKNNQSKLDWWPSSRKNACFPSAKA